MEAHTGICISHSFVCFSVSTGVCIYVYRSTLVLNVLYKLQFTYLLYFQPHVSSVIIMHVQNLIKRAID